MTTSLVAINENEAATLEFARVRSQRCISSSSQYRLLDLIIDIWQGTAGGPFGERRRWADIIRRCGIGVKNDGRILF